ncbi:hypothetical protein PHYBOEH_004576 [Phytophthora boehmeriae]|uniref:E3 ubiquitin-protein ligase CHFR n=1 Tax=Phytophthora boehmeriae TaxID=109152 RepID=A0A8T1XBI2_9STRA|nr:hypothetical protein PHYBOEH_004576 [Phytophthora boehmeriae]
MLRDITMGSWEFTHAFCVGRSRGCEVSIATSEETRTVSKRHVGVTPLAETLAVPAGGKRRWLLYDLETMNGTAVNGVELPSGGNCELRDGDEIVLASAMRQCVRLVVQFPDDACSRILVKAVARSATPSPAPSNRRSPRRAVMPNAGLTSPGFGRSAATHVDSPATARAGCRPLVTTQGNDTNSLNSSQKRSRSSPRRVSTENVETNRLEETPSSQLRKRSRRGGALGEEESALDDVNSASKKARDHEREERERLMVCPVCLEYFHGSATLPCSHTFCGYCISNWFRSSLSCPECRDIVKTVPVRNRALDELVERLVGNTEAYKLHVRRRAKLQRRSAGPRRYEHNRGISEQVEDDDSEGAARGVDSLQLGSGGVPEPTMRSSIFARWSVEEKLAFSAYIGTQFGETRVATCKKVGLTEAAVDSATMTDMLVASQNLLLDCGELRIASDECCQRLKIFLLFG